MIKLLLVSLIFPVILFSSPEWLYKIEHDKNIIIGYGIGKSIQAAKKNAVSDIANTLYISVDSSVDITNSDNNGKINNIAKTHLKTNSKATLSGVKFIKTEFEDNYWYIAAKYDNSSIDVKLKKLLSIGYEDEVQNSYLQHTPLIKKLNKEIGKKLNYKVIRKNNLWQLKYNDILLPINENNFYKLFSTQSTKSISIKPNKNVYKENDEMFFKISHKDEGYISILYVEHNGKIGILLDNYKSKKSFTFPDIKNEETFKIANPYNKSIKELYIVLHSKTPINLHKFENISDDLLDESSYNFDKLILKLHDFNFATYEIKIKK